MTSFWGWPYPSRTRPWAELEDFYAELVCLHPSCEHMLALVQSVRAVGADKDLGAFTSMHDLMVRPLPMPEPPFDVVAVRAPGSLRKVRTGVVVIEHLATSGHDERIERPVADTAALFWRFAIEKFGIDPCTYRSAGHP